MILDNALDFYWLLRINNFTKLKVAGMKNNSKESINPAKNVYL